MGATPHDRGIDFLEVGRDGCMRMLAVASGALGRVGLSISPPTIRPVNHAFDHQPHPSCSARIWARSSARG